MESGTLWTGVGGHATGATPTPVNYSQYLRIEVPVQHRTHQERRVTGVLVDSDTDYKVFPRRRSAGFTPNVTETLRRTEKLCAADLLSRNRTGVEQCPCVPSSLGKNCTLLASRYLLLLNIYYIVI